MRAGKGLGMEPSIVRIFVFSTAIFTHFKGAHGRALPVERHGMQNAEPGTTGGAGGKRVLKSAIASMLHFLKTLLADRSVERNAGGQWAGVVRIFNSKSRSDSAPVMFQGEVFNGCRSRNGTTDERPQFVVLGQLALNNQLHTVRRISHTARPTLSGGETR